MRRILALLTLALVLVPLVEAQRGPAPGMTSLDYVGQVANDKVAGATADPVGFAGKETTPEAIANDTGEALYIACWAARENTMMLPPGCENIFTPPGTEDAQAEGEEAVPVEPVNATLDNVTDFANETLDIVNDTLADPTSAPSQLMRLVDAASDLVGDIVGAIGGLLKDLSGGLVDIGQLGLDGLKIAGSGILDGLKAAGNGLLDLSKLGLDGMQSAGSGIGNAFGAIGDLLASATKAVGKGLEAVGGGALDGAKAAGSGIVDGVKATGDAIGKAAKGVADVVGSLFGHDDGGQKAKPTKTVKDTVPVQDGGLVDQVLDTVDGVVSR